MIGEETPAGQDKSSEELEALEPFRGQSSSVEEGQSWDRKPSMQGPELRSSRDPLDERGL